MEPAYIMKTLVWFEVPDVRFQSEPYSDQTFECLRASGQGNTLNNYDDSETLEQWIATFGS